MEAIIQRFKSKTYVFSLLLMIAGIAQANSAVIAQYLTSQQFGYFTIGVSVAVAILRELTTKSLSEK